VSTQVKLYNGTPTFFQDGRPEFYGMMWSSAPAPDSFASAECGRLYGEAGVHYFAFDLGSQAAYPEWQGPDGHYDFSTLKERFQKVIDVDPQAKFHLRVHLEMPGWWHELYPEECERLSNGKRANQSFASKIWRAQAKDFLRALVAQVESVGLGDRVVAYQCGTGHTGEWVKGEGSMGLTCGDFSLPMQEHFQGWLRQRYGDENALRTAWGDLMVTFETAAVPSADQQLKTTAYTFRDPKKEQQVIDYYRCLAELCGDLVVDFCSTVKDACAGKALAGAFYGYLLDHAWNAGFFGEGLDSEYSTYQRSGHLGLWKVLQSPAVDFLVSPYSYGFRGIGGEGSAMPPAESMRIHGKLYVFEEDSRTHLSRHDHPNYGKADTLEESFAILKRNFSYVATHGQAMWWLTGWSRKSPHVELSDEPAFRPLIKRFMEIGNFTQSLNRTPSAEVAVLVDDESFYYEWVKNSLDIPLIFQQRLWGLPHMGAPFDVYLLQDFLDGNLKPYKLYIFLNAFRLDKTRREALKRQLRKDGQTALWIYAPGYIQENASLDHMTDLTGLSFDTNGHPWGPMINLIDLDHPVTRGLPQDLTWGTNSLLGPVFHVEDQGARVLGNVVYSQGRCRPGFVVKEFPSWKSIYSAAPNLPSAVLRGIARFAGVHIYNDMGDTLYATPQLLGVHTAAGGQREFYLTAPVEVIYDLFEEKIVAHNTDQFKVTLPRTSTSLYYTGEARLLGKIASTPVE
jgi:hypothetical protein